MGRTFGSPPERGRAQEAKDLLLVLVDTAESLGEPEQRFASHRRLKLSSVGIAPEPSPLVTPDAPSHSRSSRVDPQAADELGPRGTIVNSAVAIGEEKLPLADAGYSNATMLTGRAAANFATEPKDSPWA